MFAYLKAIQDVGVFVSDLVCQSYNAGMEVHVKEHAQRSPN